MLFLLSFMRLIKQITEGYVGAASRLMRDIEDRIPDALEALKELYLKGGHAYVIGITGSPGAGKSTLVDQMVDLFRADSRGVGVIAVDPSSPFTGGAILGDRIRMQRHSTDNGVFIRSVATRGHLGGLSRAAYDIITIMDAMSKDIIMVETVGVGQNEIDIAHAAHCIVIVLTPGMGDEIQAIKAGIIEIGDIYVINKSDQPQADMIERDLKHALQMFPKRHGGWEPPILKTEALSGEGVSRVVSSIYEYKSILDQGHALNVKMKERVKIIFLRTLEAMVMEHFVDKMENEGMLDSILQNLLVRRIDPYSIAEEIMANEIIQKND